MDRDIDIQARWDPKVSVWTATSADVPGLVVEADTWPMMIEEIGFLVPNLIEFSSQNK
jgi:hypothetical protein